MQTEYVLECNLKAKIKNLYNILVAVAETCSKLSIFSI